MIDKEELFQVLMEILQLNPQDYTLQSDFNIFNYDSFTKVNIIISLEAFSCTDQFTIDDLVRCDTFGDVIELAVSMYKDDRDAI